MECHGIFAVDDMIRHGNAYVCGDCKPKFLQKLAEGAALPGTFRYAGFWRRFLAYFIDAIILSVVNFAVMLAVIIPLVVNAQDPEDLGTIYLLYFVLLAIGIAYETVLIGKYGATVGKMVCQLEVVTADGKSPSYILAFVRYFAKMLSSLIILIGYIMAAFDPEKRALHDRICNTRVVIK
jgi:uncharacterized RDD family membrane protein YckC